MAAPRTYYPPAARPGASTMAAARPPFPIYVLDSIVGVLIAKPGEEWWEIPCASKKAYGCGKKMQEALEGLKLCARLGDGPLLTSSLAIRMSVDAHRIFESELEIDPDGPFAGDLRARAVVKMAEDQGVTAIVLSFTRASLSFLHRRPLSYYLVYDAVDRSLSMFQIRRGEGVCTLKPIVPRRTEGSDYKLFFLGHDEDRSSSDHGLVLWVGSLFASSDGGTAARSKFKSMDFPPGLIHEPFNVDVVFSFQGKRFWGDLEQGLVYCDLQTSGDSDMDFSFIELPCEWKVDGEIDVENPKPMRNTRTMGCSGDSVWFVCIDIPSHYFNAVVYIWELDLPGGQLKGKRKEGQWKIFDKVPAKVLWELSSFKESGLPAAPFQYPILTADGALCFVLGDHSRFPQNELPLVDHFCSFDMRYKRLLWHGLVHDYQIFESIIMYPSSNFLEMKQCSRDSSSVKDCPAPAAEIEAMEDSE